MSTTVRMLGHPPYIIDSSESFPLQSAQQSHTGNLPSHESRSQTETHLEPSQSQMHPPESQEGHGDGCGLASRRLNEFADFLVQFNNTTVMAVHSRLEKIDNVVAEHWRRTEIAHREHEKRICDKLDSMAQVVNKVVEDGARRASSEGRDAGLAKLVSESILSALGPRFDDVNRHIEENETITRTLQTSVKSLESRLKKLEIRTLNSIAVTSEISRSPSASISTYSPASPSSDGYAVLARRMDELGFMLDRLANLVNGARDEAHLDKEDLVKVLEQRFHDLSLTFLKEYSVLKSAIGVGKGCLKKFEDNSLNPSPSLSELMESLGLDIQEAMECFKDAEAMRDEHFPSAIKRMLEMVASTATRCTQPRDVFDAAVMTEDTQNVIAENTSTSEMKVDHSNLSFRLVPSLESSNEAVSTTTPFTRGDFASGVVPANLLPVSTWSTPFPCNSTCSTRPSSSRLTLDTDMHSTPEKASPIATVLELSGIPSDPGGSLITPPPSSVSPSPSRTLKGKADTSVTDEVLENIDRESSVLSSPLTSLDDASDLFDLGERFSTPILVDNTPVIESNGFPSALTPVDNSPIIEANRSPSTLTPVDSPPVFESNEFPYPLTCVDNLPAIESKKFPPPLTLVDNPPVFDSDRPPSPLTPLPPSPSEDEVNPLDYDNDGVSPPPDSDVDREPSVAVSGKSLSIEWTSTDNDAGITAPEFYVDEVSASVGQQASSPAKHSRTGTSRNSTPHESVQVLIGEGEHDEHVRKGGADLRVDRSSARLSKRRKLAHNSGESSTSQQQSPEKSRRSKPQRSQGTIIHVHPPEVLDNCTWPAKTMVNETFDHQLLQCDRCDSSFHYCCIGVKKGDRRLIPDAEFICPPCVYVADPERPVKKNNASRCGRPDCDWPGEASNDNEDYFVVEKILGRCTAESEGSGHSYLWLIKWTGYHVKECDWLDESALPNSDELISKFYISASREGMKVHDDRSIYLLREARSKLHIAIKEKWKWT